MSNAVSGDVSALTRRLSSSSPSSLCTQMWVYLHLPQKLHARAGRIHTKHIQGNH